MLSLVLLDIWVYVLGTLLIISLLVTIGENHLTLNNFQPSTTVTES